MHRNLIHPNIYLHFGTSKCTTKRPKMSNTNYSNKKKLKNKKIKKREITNQRFDLFCPKTRPKVLELSINPFDAQLTKKPECPFCSSPLDWIWGREREEDDENCYFRLRRVDKSSKKKKRVFGPEEQFGVKEPKMTFLVYCTS